MVKTLENQVMLDNPNNPELVHWNTTWLEETILPQIDVEIQELCRSLWQHGVMTTWSCSGRPGHLCARPTIVIEEGEHIPTRVAAAMHEIGVRAYWLSEVHSAVPSTSGMTHYWMLEIPNPHRDYIAYPIARR